MRRPAPTTAELSALGLRETNIRVGKSDRWFLVQPPPDPTQPAPILIVLHGGTQSMRRIFAVEAGATRGWPDLAQRENALLIVPNGVNPDDNDPRSDNQVWNDLRQGVARESSADDVGFFLALIEWAHATFRTDHRRVYVTGASNGGMMTFRLLMEVPERFAAGAAIVTALPVDNSRIKRPRRPTPLLIANGTLDPLVIWAGGEIAGKRGRTRSIEATVNWWIEANKAMLNAAPAELLPKRSASDKCKIERRLHPASPGGAPIVAITMNGGGHTIPSVKYPIPDSWLVRRFIGPVCQDVEGIELIWQFLSANRL